MITFRARTIFSSRDLQGYSGLKVPGKAIVGISLLGTIKLLEIITKLQTEHTHSCTIHHISPSLPCVP